VGSWAAEALVRSGAQKLHLIDADQVAESNLNRQSQATIHTIGQTKTEALAERLLAINPELELRLSECFLSADNLHLLSNSAYVVDAIDQVRVKKSMLDFCRSEKIPLVVCGAAGGKTRPEFLRVCDLSDTTHDGLLAALRRLCRQSAYPAQGKMRVRCISSAEQNQSGKPALDSAAGLACRGYGSSVMVTASMGMMAASVVLNELL
jgi:tRNA A37 threonylcarbamoyladenosine dehydratase